MKISIIMLTFNAPRYVEHSIRTVKRYTVGINYELLVCDNGSDLPTKNRLELLKKQGLIDRLVYLDRNYYFVGGNNRAVEYADNESDYILLLNSDIEIRNPWWLAKMLEAHQRGITACHVCDENDCRPDGWCLLVDKDIYLSHKLDEERFIWYYSIADFGSRVMRSGYHVQTIRNYNDFIKHFGGASEVKKGVRAVGAEYKAEVSTWYPHKCEVIDHLNLEEKSTYDGFFRIYDFFSKWKRKVKKSISRNMRKYRDFKSRKFSAFMI